jgi:Ca2+-binding RTX toxin-like protein
MTSTSKPGRPRLGVERLEARDVPTTASLLGSTLVVDGTDRADYISVQLTGWQVTVSGAAIRDGRTYVSAIDASRVHQVVVHGYGGDDTINVSSIKVPTMVWGGAGNDRIYGGSGGNTIYGDQGNDTIYGGSGNDWLVGGDGNDLIYGGSGDNWISGDAGNDTLIGGRGNDSLFGGDGRDLLIGGGGNDQFNGDGFGIGLRVGPDNFNTYQEDFDLWRPFPSSVPTAIPMLGNLTNTGYLSALQAVSLADMKADIKVIARGQYDVTLPGDRRTIRVTFDGTWNDNDPMPVGGATPSFAAILLNRARLISYGLDPSRYYSQADFDAMNARTGGRLYDPADALRQFTGRSVQTQTPARADFWTLKAQVDRGQAAVVYSFRADTRTANSGGVMGDTNYAVRRLFTDVAGRKWVELGNPLGTDSGNGSLLDNAPGAVRQNDGIVTMSWYDFQRWTNFTALYVA